MEYTKKRLVLSDRVLATVLILIGMCIVPAGAFAQATFIGSSEVQDLPIDGGVSLLVAAGVGYGVKKLYGKKKEK